jgi:cytoskeletal protein CcmA (bactofilin family)
MREERGQITGDLVVAEPFTLWGSVGGSVRVTDGGKFYLRGTVIGDLVVEAGGRVHIYGNVAGNLVVNTDAKVIHSGLIGGHATNEGGRLFIEPTAKITGRVRTRSGSTRIAPRKIPLDNMED